MEVTIEQAKVLEAVARLGTIQKAARELRRSHTAVIYSLRCLETQTQLPLFARQGRRNHMTREGHIALKYCRKLLDTTREFADSCQQMRTGWEPSLTMVYDDVVDFDFIGQALFQLDRMRPPTELKIISAHLGEVEEIFAREVGNLMVTVLPLKKMDLISRKLKPISMVLVAHREHALARPQKARLRMEDLNRHTFVTISPAPGQLGLATEQMKFNSTFLVSSFSNKKIALLNRLGFGWLPDYLIESELKKGTLVMLKTDIENHHRLQPRLYFREEETLGPAARALLTTMTGGGPHLPGT